MSSRLSQLASAVSLTDEIARPTEPKNPVTEIVKPIAETVSLLSDIPEIPVQPDPAPAAQPVSPVPEYDDDEEDYDPEKEARSLVYTLTAIDQFVLNIVVLLKCRSSVGGRKGIERMKEAITKEFSGEELTDEDKKLITRMKEYKANMEALSGAMIVKPDELNRLIEVATSWCSETKFKIGSGTAFWANYVGSLAERTTKIIMS